ncbi:MAG: hypothetical protein LBG72_06670 [Spirochaetaceae bacterium]|jgi:HD-like signal output (HDOD) protein|nr:hypothetical protein [Spirochaetaceae bacterium]
MTKSAPAALIEERSCFIDTFPSFGFTKEKIIAVCDQPRTNPSDLNRLIHLDPILFCKMQFIYNSFYPRQKDEYIPIAKIITMLHLNTVRNYARDSALSAARKPAALSPKLAADGQRKEEMRITAAFVRAYTARLIAGECGIETEKLQQYYAAGLVFNFESYMNVGRKKLSADEAAKYWDFSFMIYDVLKYKNSYKKYNGAYKHILYTAAAASAFAQSAVKQRDANPAPKQDKKTLDFLGIDEKLFAKIKPAVQNEAKAQIAFLKGAA